MESLIDMGKDYCISIPPNSLNGSGIEARNLTKKIPGTSDYSTMNIDLEYIKRLNTFVVQATLHLNLEKGPRYSEDCLKHTTAFKAYCPATGTGANHNIKARLVADPGTSGDANGGTFLHYGQTDKK